MDTITFQVNGGRAELAVNDRIRLIINGDKVTVEIKREGEDTIVIPEQPGTAMVPTTMPARVTGREPYKWPANLEPPSTEALRVWAKAHKLKVKDRGRISDEVKEAFVLAHTR